MSGAKPQLSEVDACSAVLAMLAARAPGRTVCPSEVARRLAAKGTSDDWRRAMPVVHAAIDALVRDGAVALSWKGRALAQRTGPYRIGRSVAPAADGAPGDETAR